MYLGLDLRGGVHFLLQVDMQAALTKRIEGLAGESARTLRDKNVRHAGIVREGQTLRIRFREAPVRAKARDVIGGITNDLLLVDRDDGQDLMLVGTLKPEAQKSIQEPRSSRTSSRSTSASTSSASPSR
jgi:preprotein translocase subunit SecD